MRYCLIFILFFLLSGPLAALAQKSLFRKADNEFNRMRYKSAIHYYEKGLASDSLNIQSIERLALSYKNVRDYKNAEKWFARAINLNSANENNYLYYAEALASNNKYEISAFWYNKLAAAGDIRAAGFFKTYSDHLNVFYTDSAQWKIHFTSLNTAFDEFSPVFFKKGLMFASNRNFSVRNKFVSGWDFKPFIDLYLVDNTSLINQIDLSLTSKSPNEKELRPVRQVQDNRTLGDFGVRGLDGSGVYAFIKNPTKVTRIKGLLRSKFHDGPISLPRDEQLIMFTRNNLFKGQERLSRDGVNKLKLYSASLLNNEWKNIKEFEYNSNEYSTAHPALSADGKVLYFSSDMPGGMGGMDLYYSLKQNDKWSRPVNLGPKVNTKGDEVFPYLRGTGELYFSSTGLPGLGGLDIFKVLLDKYLPGNNPLNLGYPVNSERDDFGIIYKPETDSGYFSSNRKGNDDIYSFKYNPAKSSANNSITTVQGNNSISSTQPAIVNDPVKQKNINNTPITVPITNAQINKNVLQLPITNKPIEPQSSIKKDTVFNNLPANNTPKIASQTSPQQSLVSQPTNKTLGSDNNNRQVPASVTIKRVNIEIKKIPSEAEDVRAKETGAANVVTTSGLTDIECQELRKKFHVDNIYYTVDQYYIRQSELPVLERLINLMKAYPHIQVIAASHTDTSANSLYNDQLSKNRSAVVKGYLVSRGIAENRIKTEYFGKRILAVPCKTGDCDAQQLNRRTEFYIIYNGVNLSNNCK